MRFNVMAAIGGDFMIFTQYIYCMATRGVVLLPWLYLVPSSLAEVWSMSVFVDLCQVASEGVQHPQGHLCPLLGAQTLHYS